jgi:5'-3' exonuclease
MGVPGFFKWLLVKYKNRDFIKNKYEINHELDSLLIDTNCLLHPQCFKILNDNPHSNDHDKLEDKMMKQCIKYLDEVINFINPTKEVYIAIDGVAPVAKMKQQRQRRYKSVNDKILFDNIKKKHDKEITTYWNNSAITPGTKFMKKLTNRIINYCKELKNNKNIKIIFSTAETPSEGEHKLLQHIRNSNNNYKYVVYGLDADLIFLSLSANKDNIYLMRESNEINKNNKEIFNLVDIDILKNCIIEQVSDIMSKNDLEKDKIIRDFIFICYFLGNDFLPHIPSIDIKCFDKNNINGLDLVLQAYANTYESLNQYLIIYDNKIEYNIEFLQLFLDYLSSFEEEFFIKMYNNKKKFYRIESNDSYEMEKNKIENLLFKIDDDIELGKDDKESYKFRYYSKYYNSEINQKELIKYSCYKYIEGLIWVANYYFNKCKSWDWYFPFDHAPFISDLADNLKRFNLDEIKFNIDSSPLKPVEQLLCILPNKSNYLVPKEYRWLMTSVNSPIINLYPDSFNLDLLYKNKYWECIPILPDLEIDNVKKEVSKIDKLDNSNYIKEVIIL